MILFDMVNLDDTIRSIEISKEVQEWANKCTQQEDIANRLVLQEDYNGAEVEIELRCIKSN